MNKLIFARVEMWVVLLVVLVGILAMIGFGAVMAYMIASYGLFGLFANIALLVNVALIFALPYAIWRLGRTEYFAPLVVVQIVTGILLGPGVLGAAAPQLYAALFPPPGPRWALPPVMVSTLRTTVG